MWIEHNNRLLTVLAMRKALLGQTQPLGRRGRVPSLPWLNERLRTTSPTRANLLRSSTSTVKTCAIFVPRNGYAIAESTVSTVNSVRLDNTDDNSLLSVNYAGFAPVLVEGFKELQDRIVHLEQHQQQLLHGRQQPGIADEVTTEGVTTSRDSTVIRRGRHAWGGIDVFEREAKILADELGCNCQQDDNRIGRLERQVLELQRKLEGGTALPSG